MRASFQYPLQRNKTSFHQGYLCDVCGSCERFLICDICVICVTLVRNYLQPLTIHHNSPLTFQLPLIPFLSHPPSLVLTAVLSCHIIFRIQLALFATIVMLSPKLRIKETFNFGPPILITHLDIANFFVFNMIMPNPNV